MGNNIRKSKGYAFMAFRDAQTARLALRFLNNNPTVFGGTQRPIVEFTIEDKRMLRMQRDLYAAHAHKLTKVVDEQAAAKGAGKGKPLSASKEDQADDDDLVGKDKSNLNAKKINI